MSLAALTNPTVSLEEHQGGPITAQGHTPYQEQEPERGIWSAASPLFIFHSLFSHSPICLRISVTVLLTTTFSFLMKLLLSHSLSHLNHKHFASTSEFSFTFSSQARVLSISTYTGVLNSVTYHHELRKFSQGMKIRMRNKTG